MAKTAPVAIVDFDDTMRRGDSIAALIRYAARRKYIRPLQLLRIIWGTLLYLFGLRNENHAKGLALRYVNGMTMAEQEAFFSAFVSEVLLPGVFPEAISTMADHAAAGRLVLVVSASPDCYMRYLSPALPIQAVLATPVDARGRLGTNCKGPEKLRRIEEWALAADLDIQWDNSYGYGDSVSDMHYLFKVGFPVAVNAKRALLTAMPEIRRVTWGANVRKEIT